MSIGASTSADSFSSTGSNGMSIGASASADSFSSISLGKGDSSSSLKSSVLSKFMEFSELQTHELIRGIAARSYICGNKSQLYAMSTYMIPIVVLMISLSLSLNRVSVSRYKPRHTPIAIAMRTPRLCCGENYPIKYCYIYIISE